MTDFTKQEQETLRMAAFGAIYMVSNADPGIMGTIKETIAGSKALANTSPDLQSIFKAGGMPKLPKGTPADIESGVLSALQQSTAILQNKSPGELHDFRTAVMNACSQVAAAQGGVQESETSAIGKIRSALAM